MGRTRPKNRQDENMMDDQQELFAEKPNTNRFIEPNLTQYERQHQYKKMTRTQDPVTSIAAAKKTLPRIKGHKKIVLDAFLDRGPEGYTHEALGDVVPIRSDTARKRTKDLVDMGLVEDTGRKEKVSSGNYSIVWAATPKAIAERDMNL